MVYTVPAGSGVPSVVDQAPVFSGGRLSISQTVPAADGTGALLYLTPHTGSVISVYDGANWQRVDFAALAGINAGGLVANTVYDVFLDWNGGAPQLATLAWASQVARATALARQDGAWVLSTDVTQRWLGSARVTVGNQWIDQAQTRHVYNALNRVWRESAVFDTGIDWGVAFAAGGWGLIAGGTRAAYVHSFLQGDPEDPDPVIAAACTRISWDANAPAVGVVARYFLSISIDGSLTPGAESQFGTLGFDQIDANTPLTCWANFQGNLGLGVHTLDGIENAGDAAVTLTGHDGALFYSQSGIMYSRILA